MVVVVVVMMMMIAKNFHDVRQLCHKGENDSANNDSYNVVDADDKRRDLRRGGFQDAGNYRAWGRKEDFMVL
eukprot:570820-Hanusia_phi.AAC.1